MAETFDAIVVGGGQAGPSLVGRLAAAGMRVAIVERQQFGGTCVNTGCMPTKAMVASAQVAHLARRAADFGVAIPDGVRVDMAAVAARAQAISASSRSAMEAWLGGMDGCTVVRGHARFTGPDTLDVQGRRLTAPRIFLNVGGRASVPPMPGIDQIPFLTNSSILRCTMLPEHLVIVGGSYVGLEFAQMFRRFGAEVTVVEKAPRLIGREDPDVSDAIHDILAAEGVAFRLKAECIGFRKAGDKIAVHVDCVQGPPEVLGSHVLMAVGRRPNTDDLGLDVAGVQMDGRGYITVDDELRTSVPGIWALGECNGRGAFTHTAYNDFEIVAANLLDGARRRVTERLDAYALFIDPPLGRVGQTEAQAQAAGRRILVGKRPMTRVSRAVEKGQTEGFLKTLVDADSGEILGASLLGVGADEAVHALIDTMAAGRSASDLARTVHIHPTVSELLPTLMGELQPLASAVPAAAAAAGVH